MSEHPPSNSPLWFSSNLVVRNAARKRLFDLETEVLDIVESIGVPLDDLDLVIDAFDPTGVHRMPAMIEDAILMLLQHPGKSDQLAVAVLAGDAAPLLQDLLCPGRPSVVPDVLQQVLQPVDRAEPLDVQRGRG